jgi:transposase
MSLADVLAPLPGMAVERVIIGDETVTLLAHLTAAARPCPACGTQAIQIHSRSRRTLLDLSVCGRQMRLSLQVRRFFCEDGSCPRTTFTEQLPDLAAPRAKPAASSRRFVRSDLPSGARQERVWQSS